MKLWAMVALMLVNGCFSRAVTTPNSNLEQILEEEKEKVELVGDATRPLGLNYVKVEAVGLVNGLDGTGSDPPPGEPRDLLMDELKVRNTENPNRLLAAPYTALVHVFAYLPPGVQQGDRVDVVVQAPARSGTSSLEGGWLMEARLKEMAVLGGRTHEGHERALAQGEILVDAAIDGDDDPVLLTRGRIPGGAVSKMARELGLVLRASHKSVRLSQRIGTVINTRFHTFDKAGIKQGVANPTRDDFIELRVHPRYRGNIARYIHVIRSLPIAESPMDRVKRIAELEQQLLVPDTSAFAALRLEALGEEGVPVLAKGLESTDPRVRFHAAEALAYLDDVRAIAPLAEAARNEPAFRWHALTALSAMDDIQVFDQLEDIMAREDSAESRYGAFRALQARGPNAPAVKGEHMHGGYWYHVIDSKAEPLIHLSRYRRPEIVLFGKQEQFQTPFVVFAGKEFIVKGMPDGKVRVSCFQPRKDEVCEECSARVDDVIRAIDHLGGNYSHVIQMLREARAKQYLACRVVLDAGPRPGRSYVEKSSNPAEAGGGADTGEEEPDGTSPAPNLFFSEEHGRVGGPESGAKMTISDRESNAPAGQKAQSGGGFFDTMKGWFAL